MVHHISRCSRLGHQEQEGRSTCIGFLRAAAVVVSGVLWEGEVNAQTCSFDDNSCSPALIRSNFGVVGNFEVVVKKGDQFCHYWRDNDAGGWHFTVCRGQGVASAASLIQSSYGNQGDFEVMYRNSDGQLCHWYRDNDDIQHSFPWYSTGCFGDVVVASSPSLIQSTYGDVGNFEVVFRTTNGQLCHYYRDNDDIEHGLPWNFTGCFGAGTVSSPSLTQSRFPAGIIGNLEVVSWEKTTTPDVVQLCHWSRGNDLMWTETQCFNFGASQNEFPVALLRDTFSTGDAVRGNLETIEGATLNVGHPNQFQRFTYERDTLKFSEPQIITSKCAGYFASSPAVIEDDSGLLGHYQVVMYEFITPLQMVYLVKYSDDSTDHGIGAGCGEPIFRSASPIP